VDFRATRKKLEELTGKECRYVVLGHLQRAGAPTAFVINLGTRLGIHAADMIKKGEFWKNCSPSRTQVISIPLEAAVGKLKTVSKRKTC